jgi:hypothetical protein
LTGETYAQRRVDPERDLDDDEEGEEMRRKALAVSWRMCGEQGVHHGNFYWAKFGEEGTDGRQGLCDGGKTEIFRVTNAGPRSRIGEPPIIANHSLKLETPDHPDISHSHAPCQTLPTSTHSIKSTKHLRSFAAFRNNYL